MYKLTTVYVYIRTYNIFGRVCLAFGFLTALSPGIAFRDSLSNMKIHMLILYTSTDSLYMLYVSL